MNVQTVFITAVLMQNAQTKMELLSVNAKLDLLETVLCAQVYLTSVF